MNQRTTASRRAALGLTVMASMIAQAYAQQTAPAPAADPAPATTAEAPITSVQVTGYRNSLLSSARDKKEAVGFQDSINAEDFGKFPDKNLPSRSAAFPASASPATSPARA